MTKLVEETAALGMRAFLSGGGTQAVVERTRPLSPSPDLATARAAHERLTALGAGRTAAGGAYAFRSRQRESEALAGVTPEVMRDRFATAKASAAELEMSLRPKGLDVNLQTRPADLLKQCLRPFAFHFDRRLGLIHLSILLGMPPDTFYGYLYDSSGLPAEHLLTLLNTLEIEDPSWLTVLLYKNALKDYFDLREREGKVALVERRGRAKFHDYEFLKTVGQGGLIYEARVAAGLNLEEVAARVNRHPKRRQIAGGTEGEMIGRYERNQDLLDNTRNQHLLGALIDVLGLSPSEAFIGAGRSWLPGLVPVFTPKAWRERGSPIIPPSALPYAIETPHYSPPRGASIYVVKGGEGIGAFLRRVRLLSGIKLSREEDGGALDAATLFDVRPGAVREWEVDGRKVPFETLQGMATHYAEAIRRSSDGTREPLDELVFQHNRSHFPQLPPKFFMDGGRPLYLTGDRDDRLARRLMTLPADHFKRRLFALRLSRGWELNRLAAELGEDPRTVSVFEDPESAWIPTIVQLRRIATLEGEGDSVLEGWRRSVRNAFYPEIPWEVLASEHLYPATREDAALLRSRFLPMGARREGDIGWALFRYRSGLRETISRPDLAERIGLSRWPLQRIERGERVPGPEALRKITSVIADADHPAVAILRDDGTTTVQFKGPSLPEILLAGRDVKAEDLVQFPAVRDLPEPERRFLFDLWTDANQYLGAFTEYLADPVSLSRELADAILQTRGLSAKRRNELAALHYDLRESVAREAVWHPELGPLWPFEIRYVLSDRELPRRDGTVSLSRSLLDRPLDRFGRLVRPLDPAARSVAQERLMTLELLHEGSRSQQKEQKTPHLVDTLFPDATREEKADLVTLHALLHYQGKGETLSRAVSNGMSLWAFAAAVAQELGIPVGRYVTAVERRTQTIFRTPVGLAQFPSVLRGMNLLGIERPEEVLYPLYRDELDWAFPITGERKRENGRLVFERSDDTPLDPLKGVGFGSILTAARIQRRWRLSDLATRSGLDEATLSNYGRNKARPTSPSLQAIVTALNGAAPDVPKIDPATAFLSTHPTFIDLFPIRTKGKRSPLRLPPAGPVMMMPYAATGRSVAGGGLSTYPTRSLRGRLDPAGFPALLQQARLRRGWSLEDAAKRLFLTALSLQNGVNPIFS